MTTPTPQPRNLCHVNDGRGPRPHVPAPALFDGEPRWSCVMCGCWLTVGDLAYAEPAHLSPPYEDADADAGSEPFKP